MAPYVEREWGEKATELMWRVKRLADPDGVLSPGVVLNRDPDAHLRNLKTTPPIEESATTCVECGFCEPVCPSRNLTTTPRQRIVLRREMARQPTGSPVQRALLEEFEYEALETCAADGSCQLACPVGIDTGLLVKELRKASAHRAGRTGWRWRRRSAGARSRAPPAPASASAARWRAAPSAARRCHPRPPASCRDPIHTGAAAVYVPSCTNRIFGPSVDGPQIRLYGAKRPVTAIVEALVEVSARAGLPVWIPEDVVGSCCGLPWSSKGFGAAHRHKANEMVERLWRGAGRGRCRSSSTPPPAPAPIADPGPGVLYEENAERLGKLEILDSVAWAHDRLLPWLEVGEKVGSATVHPTCADPPPGPRPPPRSPRRRPRRRRLRAPDGDLLRLRRRPRHLPPGADRRGHRRREASELAGRHFDAHLSSNRTCEIGLERATGEPYESRRSSCSSG